jgi:hypothetical protein
MEFGAPTRSHGLLAARPTGQYLKPPGLSQANGGDGVPTPPRRMVRVWRWGFSRSRVRKSTRFDPSRRAWHRLLRTPHAVLEPNDSRAMRGPNGGQHAVAMKKSGRSSSIARGQARCPDVRVVLNRIVAPPYSSTRPRFVTAFGLSPCSTTLVPSAISKQRSTHNRGARVGPAPSHQRSTRARCVNQHV